MASPSTPDDSVRIDQGLDALRVGLLVADADDNVAYSNAHFRHLFAVEPPELGAPVESFLSRLGGVVEADMRAWAEGRKRRREKEDRRPVDLSLTDGRVIEVKERPLPDGSGSVSLWSDVTDARRQRARLEDAIDASSEGFAFFDRDGRLDLWNAGFALALCGADGIERGVRLSAILARARAAERVRIVGDPPAFDETVDRPRSRDFLFEHIDGRFLRLRARPTSDGGSVAVLTDLTADRAQGDAIAQRGAQLAEATSALRESRLRLRLQTASLLGLKEELFRAKREADEAERAKIAFLRTMSHELRTPLNSIIGFSEIVEQELCGPIGSEKYKEYAAHIRESGRRLLRIINRILDITRLETGVMRLASDIEGLDAGLALVEPHYRKLADEIGVSFVVELSSPAPEVWGDEGALRTILENLLDNAFAHTPAGGVVTVSAREVDHHVVLSVTDTGCGIAPYDLERVLLPFEQAGTPERPTGDGAGLGLAIVKALAEGLGGAFELHSTLGRGTQALVTLRAASSPAIETLANERLAAGSAKI